MISIIICSRTSDIDITLKENIKNTIDADYELIIIDNSNNDHSIFSAYNEGVRRAKGDILCFMHEDILFHTQNWGRKVESHLKDQNVGLIGVVGGHYLPDCPASWWSTECRSGQVIQGENNNIYSTRTDLWYRYKDENCNSIQVVAVDGFWFCIPCKLFNKIRFDDVTFKGFHCYDTDICMQINQLGFEVRVVFDILIEHFSRGTQDESYLDERDIHYNKWRNNLPIVQGIELNPFEIEDRLTFVKYLNESKRLIIELQKIRKSKAYRLGKFLLKPFSWIRKIIKV